MAALDRRVRRAAEREAARHGVTVEFSRRTRHHHMTVTRAGQSRSVAVSHTPRTDADNQADWVRQDIRKLARELR